MNMKTNTIKQRRIKVADSYMAQGYGRGTNKRSVYEIDGKYYAYHPVYARQAFDVQTGELEGYVEVKKLPSGNDFFYAA